MAAAAEIIGRALRMLRVVDANEAPEAEDAKTAIQALNGLGIRWAANGLLEQWERINAPADEVSAPDTATDALTFALASRLRPEYGTEIAADIAVMLQEAVAYLWRDRLVGFGDGTVGATVARALRMLVTAGRSPDSYRLPGAIKALNDMLRRWEANGLALGWSDVEELSDPLPAPPEAAEAIAYSLAVSLAPEYEVPVSQDIARGAAEGISALRRDMLVANPLVLRQRLPRCGRYNIYTDEYDC